jgi:hypothetical protein
MQPLLGENAIYPGGFTGSEIVFATFAVATSQIQIVLVMSVIVANSLLSEENARRQKWTDSLPQ